MYQDNKAKSINIFRQVNNLLIVVHNRCSYFMPSVQPTAFRKVPICVALCHEQLASKALWHGTRQRGITQFYLPPTRLSTSGMNHTCLYFPTAERHRILAGNHFQSRLG